MRQVRILPKSSLIFLIEKETDSIRLVAPSFLVCYVVPTSLWNNICASAERGEVKLHFWKLPFCLSCLLTAGEGWPARRGWHCAKKISWVSSELQLAKDTVSQSVRQRMFVCWTSFNFQNTFWKKIIVISCLFDILWSSWLRKSQTPRSYQPWPSILTGFKRVKILRKFWTISQVFVSFLIFTLHILSTSIQI